MVPLPITPCPGSSARFCPGGEPNRGGGGTVGCARASGPNVALFLPHAVLSPSRRLCAAPSPGREEILRPGASLATTLLPGSSPHPEHLLPLSASCTQLFKSRGPWTASFFSVTMSACPSELTPQEHCLAISRGLLPKPKSSPSILESTFL